LLSKARADGPDIVNSSTTSLLRYLLLLPLAIACSIKTREPNGTFKPEYIIPQLLLQYVIASKEVDGIMFPSTKVAYHQSRQVPAYNYIFPVKQSSDAGFCNKLVSDFILTEPTSTEIETLLNYSGTLPLPLDRFNAVPGEISLVEGVWTPYQGTAFGRLEEIMHTRPAATIYDF
jgi:hypothetical protein